jgi:teichuronic acid biosynthesis glycosyltransferase TuaH
MNNHPEIIMLALPRWDGAFSSTAYSLAKEMSRQTAVFYIDNPYTWKDLISGLRDATVRKRISALLFGYQAFKSIPGESANLIAITPGVIFPINFLPRGFLYETFSKINNYIVKRSIKRIIRRYNLTRFIFINSYNPFYLQDAASLGPILSVYHCVDNIAESRYVNKHGTYLEERMIKGYDLTLVTSRKLEQYAVKFGKPAYLLPNAVDFELFTQRISDQPVDFKKSSTKVIGYIGSVDHRVDYELLKNIALSFPDFVVLLVGPLSKEYIQSGLAEMPNIVVTGAKRIEELPGYLNQIDCAIIPFLCNELTSCIYPLKLNEYLAAGKPVVSTPFSVDLVDFKDVICISSADQFSNGLLVALKQTGDEWENTRRSTARKNTWANRAEEFWKIVSRHERK